MSFDWSCYLTIAELSHSAAQAEIDPLLKEAHCRCAISRAYYSAFNVAFAGFATWGGGPPRDGSVHQWLIDRYENIHTADAAKKLAYSDIAAKLIRLRALRVNADYGNVFDKDPERQTASAIRFSKTVAEKVAQIH